MLPHEQMQVIRRAEEAGAFDPILGEFDARSMETLRPTVRALARALRRMLGEDLADVEILRSLIIRSRGWSRGAFSRFDADVRELEREVALVRLVDESGVDLDEPDDLDEPEGVS